MHRHRFKIYTLVSDIHENVDLVLGIKNVFNLESVINSRDCCFKFLNRSVPIFLEKEVILKPNEQKLIKVKAPFVDEISGMAIIKILDGGTYSTLLIKLKFTCNKAVLDIINKGNYTDKIECILQTECNFLHGYFRSWLPVEVVDVEVKITSMQGTHIFRRDRMTQLIKCTLWSINLCPHPRIVKKMRTFLEVEVKMDPIPQATSSQYRSP